MHSVRYGVDNVGARGRRSFLVAGPGRVAGPCVLCICV